MIRLLQIYLAPLVGVGVTLWAAVVALAVEAYAPLPRMLAHRGRRGEVGLPSVPRQLHLIRLTLLLIAGAMAATAVGWWTRSGAEAIPRLLLVVVLVWLVGDLMPRVLAALAPDAVEAVQGAARFSVRVFRPVLRILAWMDRRTRASIGDGEAVAADRGREMLRGVFSLREMTVAEVMTPRIDVIVVDVADRLDEVVEVFRESGYARLLVIEGSPDAVVGVIFAKDLMPRADGSGPADWTVLVRQAPFVPEAKTLVDQLRDFQRGLSHLAVVVDEFGGTAGLVTLEDILEQIVGEIQDEYDTEEAPIQPQESGRWVVLGGVALAELEALLNSSFDREDVDTVGGLVLAALGHVPRVGESVEVGAFRLTVNQVLRRRVGRVTVESLQPKGRSEGDR